ncbi:MAG TPA: hypothetical protein VGS78_10460 [Candidatus Sulfotelmatobacter sp.]|nr:hypothetical protein [Candidatus Sulfotelmatobacter sp.]
MRILLDHNVPIGVRALFPEHEIHTVVEMRRQPQIENGELITAAESTRFDVLITSDLNIEHQQNLQGRKLAFIVLGSNIWPIVRSYGHAIAEALQKATPGGVQFIEMTLPKKPQKSSSSQ